jgi:hypothetical protein
MVVKPCPGTGENPETEVAHNDSRIEPGIDVRLRSKGCVIFFDLIDRPRRSIVLKTTLVVGLTAALISWMQKRVILLRMSD